MALGRLGRPPQAKRPKHLRGPSASGWAACATVPASGAGLSPRRAGATAARRPRKHGRVRSPATDLRPRPTSRARAARSPTGAGLTGEPATRAAHTEVAPDAPRSRSAPPSRPSVPCVPPPHPPRAAPGFVTPTPEFRFRLRVALFSSSDPCRACPRTRAPLAHIRLHSSRGSPRAVFRARPARSRG